MAAYDDLRTLIDRLEAADIALSTELSHLQAAVEPVVMANPISYSTTPQWIEVANKRRLLAKHQEWGRKLYGIALGYYREFAAGEMGLAKGREIGFDNADVTIGTNQHYAKAVQFKSSIQDDDSAINNIIAEAANQLTGEKGEVPLATQRKIIDVTIASPNNWWPFSVVDLTALDPEVDLSTGVIPRADFVAKAEAKIGKKLDNYKAKKRGLNAVTKQSLHQHAGAGAAPVFQQVVTPGVQDKSKVFQPVGGSPTDIVTIKINYAQPRPVLEADGVRVGTISRMSFSAYVENNIVKAKILICS